MEVFFFLEFVLRVHKLLHTTIHNEGRGKKGTNLYRPLSLVLFVTFYYVSFNWK